MKTTSLQTLHIGTAALDRDWNRPPKQRDRDRAIFKWQPGSCCDNLCLKALPFYGMNRKQNKQEHVFQITKIYLNNKLLHLKLDEMVPSKIHLVLVALGYRMSIYWNITLWSHSPLSNTVFLRYTRYFTIFQYDAIYRDIFTIFLRRDIG